MLSPADYITFYGSIRGILAEKGENYASQNGVSYTGWSEQQKIDYFYESFGTELTQEMKTWLTDQLSTFSPFLPQVYNHHRLIQAQFKFELEEKIAKKLQELFPGDIKTAALKGLAHGIVNSRSGSAGTQSD